MSPEQFTSSDIGSVENVYLRSLWYDFHRDWEQAHTLIQDIETPDAAAIHAYLHRKEGDIWNADYWYRKAVKNQTGYFPDQEWKELVLHFMADS